MSLRLKLIIALIIPIIGMVYFTTQIGMNNIAEETKINKLKINIKDSIYISNLVHELQKERGLSSGFIGSKGKKFQLELKDQRALTDLSLKKFKNYISSMDVTKKYSYLFMELKILDAIRNSVDKQNITASNILKYYSVINEKFLDFIEIQSMKSNSKMLSQMQISYINILRAKETAGIERGLLSNGFASGKIDNEMYRQFCVLVASQETYLKSFKSFISKKQLINFNKKMANENVYEVDRLRELVFDNVIKIGILTDIKELIGYGGMIHSFKNYVLRGEQVVLDNFSDKYNKVKVLIEQYKNLEDISRGELFHLNTISNTFAKYNKLIYKVKVLRKEQKKIGEIDQIVKLNDHKALEAINILSNTIIGADSAYWFKVTTKKINLLKEVENDFIIDLNAKMNSIVLNARDKLNQYIVITLFVIFIILFISVKLIYETTISVKELKKGLNSFFKFLTHENSQVEYAVVKYNDELGDICNSINSNIKDTKNFLDAKIKQQTDQNSQKDKLIAEQAKMASMGEMIANIAHQWRQPLSVISTASTGMLMEKEYDMLTDKNLKKYCNSINNNAQYLSKTIDDFKNFIEGDRVKNLFKLSDTIESFLHLVDGTIKSQGIEIHTKLDHKVSINGYENELIQCFINIFNNAKDVLIEEQKSKKCIFITTEIKSDFAVIKIKDNASGIKEDILTKIFEPYFTTKHKSQGTGLGLHMTYGLISDGMNGTIEVNNRSFHHEGEEFTGAEFTISIPVS